MQECKGDVVQGFKPFARFDSFGDSALIFVVGFKVAHYSRRSAPASLLNKNILALFRKNKIGLPFPSRTVYLKNDGQLMEKLKK